MELAMRCRDSDDGRAAPAFNGSEWTVCVDRCSLVVAFPGSARQQVLEPGDTPCEKVADLRDSVIARGVLARIRQRCLSACPSGLASVSSLVREHGGLRAVHLNFVRSSGA